MNANQFQTLMASLFLCTGSLLSFNAQARDVKHFDENKPLTKIAFGSCNFQRASQSHWKSIARKQPDLWIWGGDNIYADHLPVSMRAGEYKFLRDNEWYKKFRTQFPIVGTWDDHDFGYNDVGGNYRDKVKTQKLMLDFFDVPTNSPRRKQEGVYYSWTFGPEGKQVKVVTLDLRYFREAPGKGADILGANQWQWLEREFLENTSQLVILVSSSQLVAPINGAETWSQYSEAREHLFELIDKTPGQVIVLSGDRHFAEVSKVKLKSGKELYDFTASGLTHFSKSDSPNEFRVGERFNEKNFGLLTLDWSVPNSVAVGFEINNVKGESLQRLQYQF